MIGTVLILIYRAACKMLVEEGAEMGNAFFSLVDVAHSLDGRISVNHEGHEISRPTYITKPGVRIFFTTTAVIYFFLRQTVPGCLTVITYEETDHGLSFTAKPAYTSAFGTHRADVVHQFGNSSVSLEIRPPCRSLAIMSRQTDERD